MSNEEFITKIKESRTAYIQAAEDSIDALERLDFEEALNRTLSVLDILGMDVMETIMRWYDDNDTKKIDKKVDRIVENLNERSKNIRD